MILKTTQASKYIGVSINTLIDKGKRNMNKTRIDKTCNNCRFWVLSLGFCNKYLDLPAHVLLSGELCLLHKDKQCNEKKEMTKNLPSFSGVGSDLVNGRI